MGYKNQVIERNFRKNRISVGRTRTPKDSNVMVSIIENLQRITVEHRPLLIKVLPYAHTYQTDWYRVCFKYSFSFAVNLRNFAP